MSCHFLTCDWNSGANSVKELQPTRWRGHMKGNQDTVASHNFQT